MLSFLSNHAMKNAWCIPKQDTQAILKTVRVTDKYGVFNTFKLGWGVYSLPEKKKRFSVYQIGQLNPALLGLFDTKDKWVPLHDVMRMNNMIFEVYTAKGVMFPRFNCYYRWTENRNLLIAIKENKTIPWDMINEQIYFRVYSGSYFNILRKDLNKDVIDACGLVYETKTDIDKLMVFFRNYYEKSGYLYIWVNGWLRDVLDVTKLQKNDVVEMLYDSTIYKKLSVKLTDLATFDSILDAKTKYLVSYKGNEKDLTVDYFDDMDFYIKRKHIDDLSENKGAYFHRNHVDAVRQLTHRDYSICVAYCSFLIKNNSFFYNEEDVYVDIYIRKSGLDRKLIFVENRIHELYKLDYLYRVNALLGIRSNVEIWRADNLENSDYMKLMSSEELITDDEFIAKAYGYNAISMLTGNTPTIYKDFITEEYTSKIELPYNLQQLGACYEYDYNGKLLEVHNNRYGCTYPIRNYDNTKMVEVISGYATDAIDDQYNASNIPIYSTYEYRVYRCPKGKEHIPTAWKDITNALHHTIKNDKLIWITDQTNYTTLVRSDRSFLDYDLLIKSASGYFSFNIIQKVLFNNESKYVKMFVPMGCLDIYLNGYSLVEGIDYIVDFPKVVIISKKYLIDPLNEKQVIHVRFNSFCRSDLTRIPPKQKGYVKHNTISLNKKYDTKDDKVLRFVIGGATVDRTVLGFSEDNTVISVPDKIKEGSPYSIRDHIVPYRNLIKIDTYEHRAKAEYLDSIVEDYMGQFKKDKEYPQEDPVETLYPLYSPFISAVINDFNEGKIKFTKLTEHYSKQDVMEYMKDYLWLLKFDPVYSTDKMIDYEYCIVHPTYHNDVITVNLYQYKFLEQVVDLYMKKKVKLSHFLKIGEYNGN